MHDDPLAVAIKDAGERFEAPWPDVRSLAKRGRRRWWLARAVAATASLALVAGGVAVTAQIEVDPPRPARPAAASLGHWERIPDAPISGRIATASAWTGEELIVTGGTAADTGLALGDAAAYDPATKEWDEIPGPPRLLYGQTAVWTGREVLLWGGEGDEAGHGRGSGYAFDPSTRTWRELPKSPYWSLGSHTAVWTGRAMIVWGGVPVGRGWGAAYDPATDAWTPVPDGPLGTRHGHEAVWTGEEMVVWGGLGQAGKPLEGPEAAAYDPATKTWRPLPDSPLEPVDAAVSFWTGEEVVVAGGLSETTAREGAAYDAAKDRWRSIAPVPVASDGLPITLVDVATTPVWTGREAVFVTGGGVLTYAPESDRWTRLDAPRDAWRMGATTAWTGAELLVWSGAAEQDASAHPVDGWSARD